MNPEPLRILLVDDDEDTLLLVRDMLEEAAPGGYDIEWRMDGASARELAAQTSFDLFLIDYRLGIESGLDLISALAADLPDTPSIVLTGHAERTIDREALDAGAADFLPKAQLSPDMLERSIRYAIARKRAEINARECVRLGEAAQAMEEVVSVVAHELRTPLTSIRLLSELLMGGEANIGREECEIIRQIQQQSIRMADLVSNVLEATRIDSGNAHWNWDDVPLRSVCSDAIETVAPLVSAAVSVECEVDPEDLSLRGDRDALARMLINLLANAVTHTKEGWVRVRCEPDPSDPGNHVFVHVSDTGSGMSPEVCEQLGRRFVLNSGVVRAGRVGGAGLGLAICARIAAIHGGSIGVQTTKGKGSCFSVRLARNTPEAMSIRAHTTILREAA